MTKERETPPNDSERAAMHQFLQTFGVTQVHGLELLRLVKMCSGAYDRVLADLMRDHQISHPQWRILIRLHLSETKGVDSLSPTDIAHSQRVSKNTISAHLRSLEEAGLIERRQDPQDLRGFRIRLTAHARELLGSSMPQVMAFLNELTHELSQDEVNELQRLLQKLHQSLTRAKKSC